jgi:transcriptional regulator with XRE-family HTH domain
MSRASRGTELFGHRLRELRRKRDLTQEIVADRVGCSQSHLSTIEWGERVPNLLMILRLALALECKVADLTCFFDRADLRSMLPENDVRPKSRRTRGPI